MPSFEFDAAKSQANLAKHGIDFIQAQRIWEDPDFIEINAKSVNEPRALVIGRVDRNCWSAMFSGLASGRMNLWRFQTRSCR